MFSTFFFVRVLFIILKTLFYSQVFLLSLSLYTAMQSMHSFPRFSAICAASLYCVCSVSGGFFSVASGFLLLLLLFKEEQNSLELALSSHKNAQSLLGKNRREELTCQGGIFLSTSP